MQKLPVQISNILKVSKKYGSEVSIPKIGIGTSCQKVLIHEKYIKTRYQKVSIPEFCTENRYRKVSIPEKGIDTQL